MGDDRHERHALGEGELTKIEDQGTEQRLWGLIDRSGCIAISLENCAGALCAIRSVNR